MWCQSYSFSKCFWKSIDHFDHKGHNEVDDDEEEDNDDDNTDDDDGTTVLAFISGLEANRGPGELCCACCCLLAVQSLC